MVATREPGRWSGGSRSVEEHRREYDWDGAIGPGCAEIVALIRNEEITICHVEIIVFITIVRILLITVLFCLRAHTNDFIP